MEIGIYTFGETTRDPGTGKVISFEQRLKDMLEEAELADQLGLEVYGVGEHHRRDFSVSSPAVVLAAAGANS
jgi:alkanesulfonate monooxygenase SsuD/methylene tetrahydromethanopterin reductase-like flavin-dependent oxidoreductase (luciferase family)